MKGDPEESKWVAAVLYCKLGCDHKQMDSLAGHWWTHTSNTVCGQCTKGLSLEIQEKGELELS